MLHATMMSRLGSGRGPRWTDARSHSLARGTDCTSFQPVPSGIPVLRLDLFLVLILAAACGAITASATGHFEPLPLFAGVIVAGVLRSVRMSRQRG